MVYLVNVHNGRYTCLDYVACIATFSMAFANTEGHVRSAS